jgi:hypothetical protein
LEGIWIGPPDKDNNWGYPEESVLHEFRMDRVLPDKTMGIKEIGKKPSDKKTNEVGIDIVPPDEFSKKMKD